MAKGSIEIEFPREAVDSMRALSASINTLMSHLEPIRKWGTEPDEPGLYMYDQGNQNMVFCRTYSGDWFVMFDNGEANECHFDYIEQSLSVNKLVRLDHIAKRI